MKSRTFKFVRDFVLTIICGYVLLITPALINKYNQTAERAAKAEKIRLAKEKFNARPETEKVQDNANFMTFPVAQVKP